MSSLRKNRTSTPKQEKNQSSSLVMFLLMFSGFVAIIGLIYIYGDFSQRKGQQLAGFVEVQRKSSQENTMRGQSSTTQQSRPGQGSDTQAHQGLALGNSTDEAAQTTLPQGQDGSADAVVTNVISEEGQTIVPMGPDTATHTFDESVELGLIGESTGPTAVPKKEKKTEPAPKLKKRNTRVFFIRATDSGHLSLRGTSIEISDDNSPLTFAIQALLKGPSLTERSHGMSSLIPEGSRLVSATVREGVAYLDFNEDFRFNPLGTDGYQAQLQQIVYTATEFPSVQSVQILVEGKKIDYLHEGIYVGEPLSRESFR